MSKYWLADKPSVVISKVAPYHTNGMVWSSSNPMMQTWLRNTYAYYSNVLEANSFETSLLYEGEVGELVKMMVPQARSLIRQTVTLTTKQDLAFKSMAERKGSSDVVQVTRLANALGTQIVEQQDMDLKGEDMTELALVQGMSFIEPGWRSDRGEIVAFDQGQAVYAGGLELANRSVFDVLWNTRLKNWENQVWIETRCKEHRWSLIAQFPHLKQQIMALPSAAESGGIERLEADSIFEDDMIWVYKIYHANNPVLPNGRLLIYSDEKTVYYNGINPYGKIPVEPMIPERIGDMCLGYPMLSNLLPCQEMLDHTFSAIATNESATAVQNIAVARGANVSYDQLAGMNWFTYTPQQGMPNSGKPEGINLSATSKDSWQFIPMLMEHLQQLSNISGALRGQPPPGANSGRAIATLVANALEFMTLTQRAYTKTQEKVMMNSVECYRRFASRKQIVHMAGRAFESYTKDFVGKDLDPIKAMKLQRMSPMMQTQGGRIELAEMLQKGGYVKDGQHFLSILEGNHPSEMYETELSETDLIQGENENLMDGKAVLLLSSDDHGAHFRKHMALANDPNVRNNSERLEFVLKHAFEHLEAGKNTDPFLMALARTGKVPEGGPPPEEPPPEAGGMPSGMGGPIGETEARPAEPAEDALGRAA